MVKTHINKQFQCENDCYSGFSKFRFLADIGSKKAWKGHIKNSKSRYPRPNQK